MEQVTTIRISKANRIKLEGLKAYRRETINDVLDMLLSDAALKRLGVKATK